MNIDQTIAELTALPVADRLRVLAALWDSIENDTPVQISAAQQAELRRRVSAHKANADRLLSWEQVLDRLRGRRWGNARTPPAPPS